MKHILLLICFIYLFTTTTFAQNNTISAKIRSTKDSLPIAYSHVGNPQLGIGTVSNINGDFKYHYDKTIDSIHISHLGYNKLSVTTKNLSEIDSVFYLTPLSYDIAEVKVIPKDSILNWITKAIKNIDGNYPKQIHYMSAFYRECQYNQADKNYTRLIEAAIEVQDRGIKSKLNTLRCKVIELRKSEDSSELTKLGWILEKIFPSSNNLYKSLQSDPVRNYFPYKRENLNNCLIRIQNNPDVSFNLLKSYHVQGSRIVEIEYASNGFLSTYGRITINISDFAILKLSTSSFISTLETKDKPGETITTEYKKMGKYYYPIIIRHTHITDQRKVENAPACLGFSENILVFNNHYLKRSSFEKIKRKFMVDKNDDLYKKQYDYNPDFWNNYNMLILEPLNKKVASDLEREEGLSAQFKKNAKTKL